jgi:hypothetical protein
VKLGKRLAIDLDRDGARIKMYLARCGQRRKEEQRKLVLHFV